MVIDLHNTQRMIFMMMMMMIIVMMVMMMINMMMKIRMAIAWPIFKLGDPDFVC